MGFRIWGFGVWGLGFEGWGLGLRVHAICAATFGWGTTTSLERSAANIWGLGLGLGLGLEFGP